MRSVQLTVKDARAILARAKERGLLGQSKVNRALAKQQAYDILLAGIEHQDDGEMVGQFAARNIVLEFGR